MPELTKEALLLIEVACTSYRYSDVPYGFIDRRRRVESEGKNH